MPDTFDGIAKPGYGISVSRPRDPLIHQGDEAAANGHSSMTASIVTG
jgi:hypothetical protein